MATWTLTHEGSLLPISEISTAESAKCNKSRSLLDRHYCLIHC